ncbi:hypothetical protein HG535_0E05630 [Zygotorulaspora mrakii]|uniref:Tetratricopeptide SHNi-TPR domain-containing protein n=1 Tax=Zygotorulaspora mrakii TaxID=42260 RepID=A0A7H9B681_ZYGMR|nr:uncharacterized protein HG535_0E05630 [Zygotorulaspora mrakii]QLG73479.1 hypothetical protein HG535_0E05630 [Zygotorulaspora mrakii]
MSDPGDSIDPTELQRQINGLIISGSKYTANGDFTKATGCYAELVKLDSSNPAHCVLLAKCLYQLGLQKNDMFGGGQDEEDDRDSEEEDVDVEDADASDDDDDDAFESGSENELNAKKLALNQKFFQFDHEEEEVEEESLSDNEGQQRNSEGNGDEDEQEELNTVQGSSDFTNANRVQDYLKGDVFENAIELLFRARIMYIESPASLISPASPISASISKTTSASTSSNSSNTTNSSNSLLSSSSSSPSSSASVNKQKLNKETQLKLVEIHDLLGDIDQELEDFAQSISDYEEAIRYYRDATSIENNEEIINIYLKMAESLRWLDSNNKDVTKEKQKSYIKQILELIQKRLDSGESINIEEDEQRIERLNEDLEILDKGKINIKEKILTQSSMMEVLLQQAMSQNQRSKVNDLSNMVKKKKVRK